LSDKRNGAQGCARAAGTVESGTVAGEQGKPSGSGGHDARAPEPSVERVALRVSRRTLLRVAGGGLVAVGGLALLYRGVALVTSPQRRPVGPPPAGYPTGQYQIADYGVRVLPDAESAVPTEIPPAWNLAITATLKRSPSLGDQQRLETALQAIEAAYPYSPSGIFSLVAYGLPYFRRSVPGAIFDTHLPRTAADGAPALLDAIRFPSDPSSLALEANDVVFHFRSDALDHLHDVQHALFSQSGTLADQPAPQMDLSDLFAVTSARTGFVGAGMPRRALQQAGLKFAAQVPEQAPLFMGFTSTQQSGQANEVAVSFDGRRDPLLPPLTTAKPGDYFAGGTTLHLSHLTEDLEQWYALSYQERVARMFHLNAVSTPGRVTIQTFWLNPNTTEVDIEQHQVVGHNEAIQRESRSPEGQALQLRADFNTLDPMDGTGAGPTPGVHFLAFTATSQVFHRSRIAMDGADVVSKYHLPPAANGINAFIRATRRQNFLVPPRAHRAFPLLELSQ
jgi:hypothetical protein